MKTKSKPRPKVKVKVLKIVERKPMNRVPLSAKGPEVITTAPTTTRSHPVDAKFTAPTIEPPKEPQTLSSLYHARGGRIWFQVVATPEIRAMVEMLKAKAGCGTLNDLAAKLFDEAFIRYGIERMK